MKKYSSSCWWMYSDKENTQSKKGVLFSHYFFVLAGISIFYRLKFSILVEYFFFLLNYLNLFLHSFSLLGIPLTAAKTANG